MKGGVPAPRGSSGHPRLPSGHRLRGYDTRAVRIPAAGLLLLRGLGTRGQVAAGHCCESIVAGMPGSDDAFPTTWGPEHASSAFCFPCVCSRGCQRSSYSSGPSAGRGPRLSERDVLLKGGVHLQVPCERVQAIARVPMLPDFETVAHDERPSPHRILLSAFTRTPRGNWRSSGEMLAGGIPWPTKRSGGGIPWPSTPRGDGLTTSLCWRDELAASLASCSLGSAAHKRTGGPIHLPPVRVRPLTMRRDYRDAVGSAPRSRRSGPPDLPFGSPDAAARGAA